jgi:hypothetical protein
VAKATALRFLQDRRLEDRPKTPGNQLVADFTFLWSRG